MALGKCSLRRVFFLFSAAVFNIMDDGCTVAEGHKYADALKLTIDFYCAQRSGSDLSSEYCDVPFTRPSGEQDGWVQAIKWNSDMADKDFIRMVQDYRTDSLEESLFGKNNAQNMANLNFLEGNWTYSTLPKYREDLSGGWYDAGDYVKFGLPLASAVTIQSWSMIEFRKGYENAGQWERMIDQVKWATDWLLKATNKIDGEESAIVAQIGSPEIDHKYWGRADTWLDGSRPNEPNSRYWTTCRIFPDDSQDLNQNGGRSCSWEGPEETSTGDIPFRPVYKISKSNPGSEIAGMYAAALAASSVAFRGNNIKLDLYAEQLLVRAIKVYDFSVKYQGSYITAGHIPAYGYYGKGITGYKSHLAHGSAWMYLATKDEIYLEQAISFDEQDSQRDAFGWQIPTFGTKLILATIEKNEKKESYKKQFQDYLNVWENAALGPTGLVWQNPTFWGSNRWVANQAFLSFVAFNWDISDVKSKRFWENQINILLGPDESSKPLGKSRDPDSLFHSWLVGYGVNPPRNVHHSPSSCANKDMDGKLSCSWDFYGSNYGVSNDPLYDMFVPNGMTLHGALVGGPYTCSGHYTDVRPDFHGNEVAIDYNAGFQASLSAIAQFKDVSASSTGCGPSSCKDVNTPEEYGSEYMEGWPPLYCNYASEYDECQCLTSIHKKDCSSTYESHIVCPGLVDPSFVGSRENYPGWCMCEDGYTGPMCSVKVALRKEIQVQGDWEDPKNAFAGCRRDMKFSCDIPKANQGSLPYHAYKAGTQNVPMAGDSVLRICEGAGLVNGEEFYLDFCEWRDGKAKWQSEREGDACSLCGDVTCDNGSCRLGTCIKDVTA